MKPLDPWELTRSLFSANQNRPGAAYKKTVGNVSVIWSLPADYRRKNGERFSMFHHRFSCHVFVSRFACGLLPFPPQPTAVSGEYNAFSSISPSFLLRSWLMNLPLFLKSFFRETLPQHPQQRRKARYFSEPAHSSKSFFQETLPLPP